MLKVMHYDWRCGWNAVKMTLPIALILSIVLGFGMAALGGAPEASNGFFVIVGDEQTDTVIMILSVVWFAVMVALLVLTVDAIVRNLTSRMFGPEGYLTHTLPVETWELLGGKALGTWIFGVFMLAVAFCSVVLVILSSVVGTGMVGELFGELVALLPKLGAYHFSRLASGLGDVLYGIAAFLAWSFLLVVQLQFICIAARQFGRYHVAGAIILFVVLLRLETALNSLLSLGFVVCLLTSAACFWGGSWLLKHRLSL